MRIDQDFIQKVVLLLITAVISGFGIPYVLNIVQERKLRQAKLVDSQSKLLDDLTRILWKWRYLAKSVAYYRTRNDSERYECARKDYENTVWSLLEEFRTEISRSRRLVSEGAFQRLNVLYEYVIHDLDFKISNLIASDDPRLQNDWANMAHRFTKEVSSELDEALDHLAADLRLKVKA